MAESSVSAAYFMIDVNCGVKSIKSGFMKVNKYSLTVGDLLSEEIPEGYVIKEIFVSEGEDQKKRSVPSDMVFDNLLYLNKNYKKFTVCVNKIQEVGETSTPKTEEVSALDILRRAAKSYTHLPDKRYAINFNKEQQVLNHVTMCSCIFEISKILLVFHFFRPEKSQKGKLFNSVLATLQEHGIGFLPHQQDKTGTKVS